MKEKDMLYEDFANPPYRISKKKVRYLGMDCTVCAYRTEPQRKQRTSDDNWFLIFLRPDMRKWNSFVDENGRDGEGLYLPEESIYVNLEHDWFEDDYYYSNEIGARDGSFIVSRFSSAEDFLEGAINGFFEMDWDDVDSWPYIEAVRDATDDITKFLRKHYSNAAKFWYAKAVENMNKPVPVL